ncbi:MAG: hypothetical protein R3C05_11095 [Pirellulaceae bacterium]
MKIAIVHNSDKTGVIANFGQPCPENYAQKHIDLVEASLLEAGHDVVVLQADKYLLQQLESFMPADPVSGAPTGMVFNMAYGIQGENRYTHVPAMLEMAGIPYTGSSPMGHSLAARQGDHQDLDAACRSSDAGIQNDGRFSLE